MKSRWHVSIVVLGFLAPQMLWGRPMVVGYYPDWNRTVYPPSAILYENLTHIVHSFLIPNADGSLGGVGGFAFPALVQAAHAHGVKVVVSLGGWGQSVGFSPMAADSNARRRFVDNLRNFCVTNGYDGADLDWEYPASAADKANMALLVHQLRLAFNGVNPPLQLSMAGPATDWSGKWFDLTTMSADFDWIGIMTYDFYGNWSAVAGPNSALYGSYPPNDQGWVDFSVSYYSGSRGVPRQKLCIGVPFYGWLFNASSMYGTSTGASQKVYSAIAPLIQQGWTRVWDQKGQVPFLTNAANTQLISYDDSVSVAAKCGYIRSKGLAGVIIWAIGQDLLNGDQPLLRTLGGGLFVGVGPIAGTAAPATVHLFQNYPNPFNSTTQIRYHVTERGTVVMKLYDILGREVRTLVEGELSPGDYHVAVASDDLSTGVYIYRLTTQGSSVAKTMVVLR